MLKKIESEIALHFGLGRIPKRSDLIEWDGNDQLDKESAERFYIGKSWQDVFAYLLSIRNSAATACAYQLEEWTVLSEGALPYYLRSHLAYLCHTLGEMEADGFFTYSLMTQLYQLVHMHQRSPLTSVQTETLAAIARYVLEEARGKNRFDEFDIEIENSCLQFLKLLTLAT